MSETENREPVPRGSLLTADELRAYRQMTHLERQAVYGLVLLLSLGCMLWVGNPTEHVALPLLLDLVNRLSELCSVMLLLLCLRRWGRIVEHGNERPCAATYAGCALAMNCVLGLGAMAAPSGLSLPVLLLVLWWYAAQMVLARRLSEHQREQLGCAVGMCITAKRSIRDAFASCLDVQSVLSYLGELAPVEWVRLRARALRMGSITQTTLTPDVRYSLWGELTRFQRLCLRFIVLCDLVGQFAVPFSVVLFVSNIYLGVGEVAEGLFSLCLVARGTAAALWLMVAFRSLAPVPAVAMFEALSWLCPGHLLYLFDFYGTLGSILVRRDIGIRR